MLDRNPDFTRRPIDALKRCPSCGSSVHATALPEDGIPDGHHFEALFACGARISIDDSNVFCVGIGCPQPTTDEADEIYDRAEEAFTAELHAEGAQ